jgi:hypothetical protein
MMRRLLMLFVIATLQPRIVYAYSADDGRVFAFDVSTGVTHWTLRGFDNKVLRDFKQAGSAWSVDRDYVYRDRLLLAALEALTHIRGAAVGRFGVIPDESLVQLSREWKAWYEQNGGRLRFDESSHHVIVKSD